MIPHQRRTIIRDAQTVSGEEGTLAVPEEHPKHRPSLKKLAVKAVA